MLELYQAEWCPFSHTVRQRMTELGVDFVARQVAADRPKREEMRERIGADEIPTLVADGRTILGEEEILAYLDERFEERQDAVRHRAKARIDVPTFAEMRPA